MINILLQIVYSLCSLTLMAMTDKGVLTGIRYAGVSCLPRVTSPVSGTACGVESLKLLKPRGARSVISACIVSSKHTHVG